MDVPKGEFYINEGILYPTKEFSNSFREEAFKFYEVVRIVQGVCLFLEDHIARLQSALVATGLSGKGLGTIVKADLEKLITVNNNREGNIKIVCAQPGDKIKLAAYYIPHTYPTEKDYAEGVKLITCPMQRPDPNLKQVQVSASIRERISELGHLRDFYEVILMDPGNFLTEGSKSNIFLLSEGRLYTAPDEMVLKGITRQYVLSIVREQGISYTLQRIRADQLNKFEAGFICGTSPKVLPISSIDTLTMNPKNLAIQIIMQRYNQLIIDYINQRT